MVLIDESKDDDEPPPQKSPSASNYPKTFFRPSSSDEEESDDFTHEEEYSDQDVELALFNNLVARQQLEGKVRARQSSEFSTKPLKVLLQPKFKSIPEAFVQAKKEETPGKEAALKAKTLDSQILALQSVLDENENRFRREIEYFDSSRLSQSEDDTGIKSGSQAQAVDLRSSSELEFSDRNVNAKESFVERSADSSFEQAEKFPFVRPGSAPSASPKKKIGRASTFANGNAFRRADLPSFSRSLQSRTRLSPIPPASLQALPPGTEKLPSPSTHTSASGRRGISLGRITSPENASRKKIHEVLTSNKVKSIELAADVHRQVSSTMLKISKKYGMRIAVQPFSEVNSEAINLAQSFLQESDSLFSPETLEPPHNTPDKSVGAKQTPSSFEQPRSKVRSKPRKTINSKATKPKKSIKGRDSQTPEKGNKTKKLKKAPSAQIKQVLLRTTDAPVRCAVVIRRLDQVWTGLKTGELEIRSSTTGEVLANIDPQQSGGALIWSMLVVKQMVWVGLESGTILIYDAAKRKLVSQSRQHSGAVITMTSNRSSVFTGSNDFKIIQWSLNGKYLRLLSGYSGVRSLLCVGDVELWSGYDDGSIKIWDLVSGRCECVLLGHKGSVLSLITSGAAVWSGSEDETIRLWSLDPQIENEGITRVCVQVVRVDSRVSCLVRMGAYIWSCGSDPKIHVWSAKTGKLVTTLKSKGHSKFINGLLKVKRTDRRELWSHGLQDEKLCAWRSESCHDVDFADEAADSRAQNRVMRKKWQSLVRENAHLSARLQLERGALGNQLDRLVLLLATQTDKTKSQQRTAKSKIERLGVKLNKTKIKLAEVKEKLEVTIKTAAEDKIELQHMLFQEEDLHNRTKEASANIIKRHKDLQTKCVGFKKALVVARQETERLSVEKAALLLELELRSTDEGEEEAPQQEDLNTTLQRKLDDSHLKYGSLLAENECLRQELSELRKNGSIAKLTSVGNERTSPKADGANLD